MVREANINDIDIINKLGLLIEDNFTKVFDINDLLKKDYVHIYVYEEDKVYGFIHLESHFEILDLINIAVDASKQGNNIGTSMLEYAIKEVKCEKVMLEVRESNTKALNLYNKLGFIEINRRKKYYGNEDAIIMERLIQ